MATAEIHSYEEPSAADSIGHALLECTHVAIIASDRNGTIRQFNAGAARMLGCSAEDVVGKLSLTELHEPQQLAELAQDLSRKFRTEVQPGVAALAFHALHANGEPLELAYLCKGGRRLPAVVMMMPLPGRPRGAPALLSLGFDNSTSVHRDERLSTAETALAIVTHGTVELAALMLDAEGRALTWNAGADKIFGRSAPEMTGRHLSTLYSPEEVARGEPARSLNLGALIGRSEHSATCVRSNGTAFAATVTLTAMRNRSERMVGFVCLLRDLTEQRRIEAALKTLDAETRSYAATLTEVLQEKTARYRRSDELLRQLTTSIPHAIWIRGADTRELLYINPVWAKMTGLQATIGETVEHLYRAFHPDDLPFAVHESRKFLKGGLDFDCRILRPDDEVLWVRVRTFPIADAGGKVIRVAGIMEDITARREEAKRLDRLKDEFVSMVSHELRTPLTSIAGSLALLARDAEQLSEPTERLVKIARTNSERLVRLINGILDIEKIESGNLSFEMRQVRIRALVEQTIDSVRSLAAAHGVQIKLDPASADCDIRADADRLAQVVTNLLSNAIKFSPTGKDVVVAIAKGTDCVRVSVRDGGPGIPESFKPRIFEKFAQADSLKGRQKAGTGLGLSIAKEIVTRLGGEIGFEDAPGGGTIFFFELPDWAASAKTEHARNRQIDHSDKDAA